MVLLNPSNTSSLEYLALKGFCFHCLVLVLLALMNVVWMLWFLVSSSVSHHGQPVKCSCHCKGCGRSAWCIYGWRGQAMWADGGWYCMKYHARFTTVVCVCCKHFLFKYGHMLFGLCFHHALDILTDRPRESLMTWARYASNESDTA